MVLWRTSNYADLAGAGGLVTPGRWHSAGQPVVYLAEHPAAALLELLVHLEVEDEDFPESYQLLKVRVEDGVSTETAGPLAAGWERDERVTRAVGDAWLVAGRTALLGMPSVVTPETTNWVLNPRHADAGRVRVESARRYGMDGRLR